MSDDVHRTPSIHEAEHYVDMAESFRKVAFEKYHDESPDAARLAMDAAHVCAQLATAAATLQAAGMHRDANPTGPDQLDLLNRIANRLEEMIALLGRCLPGE
ncbi:MAG: hypothetical protein J2P27_01140 [Actinobacteria bacterium]|nr:hypothetical protein [Actinomycetota bacterium]